MQSRTLVDRCVLVSLLSVIVLAATNCANDVVAVDPVGSAVSPHDTVSSSPVNPVVDTSSRTPKSNVDTIAIPKNPLDTTKTPTPQTPTPADTATVPTPTKPAAPDTVRTPAPVPAPTLTTLHLVASAPSLLLGSSEQITLTGVMSDNSTIANPAVIWHADNGSITQNGMFTAAVTSGAAMVTATSGTITAMVSVNVVEPPLPTLVLPSASADDFVNSIGVNIHLGYWDTPYGAGYESIIKPRLLALGIRHVRDAGTVVSDNGWMASVYGRMQELASRGIKFDLIMQPAQGNNDYTSLGHWTRLMSYAAPAIESFEGLNEHDLSGRPNWVNETRSFQQALYAAVRTDSRTAWVPVLGPSIGHPVNAAALGSLSSVMDEGNAHPYPGGASPLANLSDHLQRLANLDGGHPTMVTETGYHTAVGSTSDHPAVSEAAMARYVPRLALDNFKAGIPRSYFYELIDEGTNLSEQEQNFGLLRNDGTPKPAYSALQNLIGILSDPGGSGSNGTVSVSMSGDTSGVARVALVKRDGRQYVILWQDVSSYNTASRTLATVPSKSITFRFNAATQVRTYDPLQSPLAATSQRTTAVTVVVADSPIVVEITH